MAQFEAEKVQNSSLGSHPKELEDDENAFRHFVRIHIVVRLDHADHPNIDVRENVGRLSQTRPHTLQKVAGWRITISSHLAI